VDDLTYRLRRLCKRTYDCTPTAWTHRLRVLTLASRQLREAGFRQMRVASLRDRHVRTLLQRWRTEGLSARTIEKRIQSLRWWAEQIGKAGVIPSLVPGAIQHHFDATEAGGMEPDSALTY
jgi:site-specific recombinase XerC